jgi:CRISPR/Cas system CSM-associated protein Csm3 (group 7 of RAMP superfamily)
VAIDRFTGGGAEGKLFAETKLPIGAEMSLRIELLSPEVPQWVEPLVAAALLDFHDGYVGIGAKVTAGYGTVRLDDKRAEAFRGLLSANGGSWVDDLLSWADTPIASDEGDS